MSNVVQFLEALARNPRPLSAEEYSATVAALDVREEEGAALLAKDADALAKTVGGFSLLCFIVPAENDEPKQDEETEEDEDSSTGEESRAA